MGQIANQMLLEWCHKVIRKIADKKESRSEKETTVQEKTYQKTRVQESTGSDSL